MNKVAVLMSTYNGEKYLPEQIDSILAQNDVIVKLYIRDDGSEDGTINIINDYVKKNTNIVFMAESNVGVGNSFMSLVYKAASQYDYYAFADQDDIWLKNKLKRAISRITDDIKPVLYCSNQILVDSEKRKIGLRYHEIPDVSWTQILCNNQISGCTMVWNRPFQIILNQLNRRPSSELLINRIHDVWVGMAAAVTGTIIYDSKGFILYRQHDSNVVGIKELPVWTEWRKKLRNPGLRNGRSLLAVEILQKFGDLIDDEKKIRKLEKYGMYRNSMKSRFELINEKEIYRFSGESPWQFKVKVLLGLF